MLRVRTLLALPLALGLAACGGTTFDLVKDGSTDDSGDAATGDAATGDAGPLACGKVICQGTEYCIHPCCGGPAPQCLPLPEDGGKCPIGFTPANCPNGPGCQQNPCTPDPPYCSPKKDACQGGMVNGRNVSCVCA